MSRVLVQFIQDRSGSMASVWDETRSGFKSFVNDLKQKGAADGVEYLFSLTTFDTLVETPVVARPIAELKGDELDPHGPRGSTALYDAVGTTIKNTETSNHAADKIIVVIVTDGQENSSREWTKEGLHSAIDAKLNAGNWTFTYLGTQPETWDDAAKIGVTAGAVRSYTPAMANQAYAATASAVHGLAISAQIFSRSLMNDYLSVEQEQQAGMARQSEPSASPRRVPTAAPPKTKQLTTRNRRWRGEK
jgi:uncharacterized protein YegL